ALSVFLVRLENIPSICPIFTLISLLSFTYGRTYVLVTSIQPCLFGITWCFIQIRCRFPQFVQQTSFHLYNYDNSIELKYSEYLKEEMCSVVHAQSIYSDLG